jgi:hypothetical protein
VARLAAVVNENQRLRPEPVREVALLKSADSPYYRRIENVFLKLYAEGLRQWQLPYVGCPFDDYLLEDITDVPHEYRVYLFANASYVTKAMRRTIRRRVELDGATAVWFYAPGYVDEDGPALANMEELTGFTFKRNDRKDFLHVHVTEPDHPYVRGIGTDNFGSDVSPRYFKDKILWLGWAMDRNDYRFSPQFYVDDPTAQVLGAYTAGGMPGFAVKKIGKGTSIFMGAPLPPPRLLANIFEESGVHLYSRTGDLIYANQRFVAFCVRSGAGVKHLRLPDRSNVFDALTGEQLDADTQKYAFEAHDGETRIFKITPLV